MSGFEAAGGGARPTGRLNEKLRRIGEGLRLPQTDGGEAPKGCGPGLVRVGLDFWGRFEQARHYLLPEDQTHPNYRKYHKNFLEVI